MKLFRQAMCSLPSISNMQETDRQSIAILILFFHHHHRKHWLNRRQTAGQPTCACLLCHCVVIVNAIVHCTYVYFLTDFHFKYSPIPHHWFFLLMIVIDVNIVNESFHFQHMLWQYEHYVMPIKQLKM